MMGLFLLYVAVSRLKCKIYPLGVIYRCDGLTLHSVEVGGGGVRNTRGCGG